MKLSISDTSTLTINGAILGESDKKASLTLVKHATLPVDFVQETIFDSKKLARALPERRSCTQVPHPDIHHDLPTDLELELGDCIGHGRSGIVFEAKPVNISPDTPNSTLPPLVVKIARQHYNKWLLREAWFYEEMQSIQGIAVPWCYGLYSARIPVAPGRGFIPWLRGWGLRRFRRANVELKECLESYVKHDGKDSRDRNQLENEERKLSYYGKFRDQYADIVRRFEDESDAGKRTTVVAVLVMEKLGEPYLPIATYDPDEDTEEESDSDERKEAKPNPGWPYGKPIPESITKEVYDAYDMMHELGIAHMDVKRDNILTAPARARSTNADSQNDSDVCKCRIIDFELSTKNNFTKKVQNSDNASYLRRLIDNLPDGDDIGENDK